MTPDLFSTAPARRAFFASVKSAPSSHVLTRRLRRGMFCRKTCLPPSSSLTIKNSQAAVLAEEKRRGIRGHW
jgi:hypothetical protein